MRTHPYMITATQSNLLTCRSQVAGKLPAVQGMAPEAVHVKHGQCPKFLG